MAISTTDDLASLVTKFRGINGLIDEPIEFVGNAKKVVISLKKPVRFV